MAANSEMTTGQPPFVPIGWHDPVWPHHRRHPYGMTAWTDKSVAGEWRTYPTVEAAAADGCELAVKYVKDHPNGQ